MEERRWGFMHSSSTTLDEVSGESQVATILPQVKEDQTHIGYKETSLYTAMEVVAKRNIIVEIQAVTCHICVKFWKILISRIRTWLQHDVTALWTQRPRSVDYAHKGLIGFHNGLKLSLNSHALLQFVNPLLLFFDIRKCLQYTSVCYSLSLFFSIQFNSFYHLYFVNELEQ